MAEKSSSTSSSTANWDEFYGNVKKAGNAVKAGKKGYKTFNFFKSDTKKSADSSSSSKKSDMKSGIDNLGSFLTDKIPGLKYVPYASEALFLIDFFVGGSKDEGPQKVTFPPLAIQLEHSFIGSIRTDYPYIGKPIFTPGSSFNPGVDNDRYPIYNEVLGVYTLLEKPKVEIYGGFVTRQYGSSHSSGNRNIT